MCGEMKASVHTGHLYTQNTCLCITVRAVLCLFSCKQTVQREAERKKTTLQDRFVHVHSCRRTNTQICMDGQIPGTNRCLQTYAYMLNTYTHEHTHTHLHKNTDVSGQTWIYSYIWSVALQRNMQRCFQLMEALVRDRKRALFYQ